jgi:hypothetical protein
MNLTELKKAAEEATEIEALDVNEDLSIFGSTSWSRTQRHFIGQCNPATILKLIAVVEAADDTPAKFQTAAMRAALKELES